MNPPVACVMVVREFEGWLLHARTPRELNRIGVKDPETVRGAKEKLANLVPGYRPSTHQLALTRGIDVHSVRRRSKSFDKFFRTIEELCT